MMIGPEKLGPHGCKQHDRPAGLAISDHCGPALGLRMKRDHALEKRGLRVRDIFNRLPGHGIGQEPDEVAGVTGVESNAHLALRLESANAGTVTGARIDNDEWTLVCIDLDTIRRHDAYQHIVHGPWQLAAVHDELAAEFEHMRRSLCGMLAIALTTLL